MGYEIVVKQNKGIVKFSKVNSNNFTLQELSNNNNINLNDYWIVKFTNHFRFLEMNEIEKYCGITCFHKDKWTYDTISGWLYKFKEYKLSSTKGFVFLHNLPPYEILNKIKIIK